MSNHINAIPATLLEIEIENFRGIAELKLSFVGPDDKPAPIVVIAGPNGCGKTTVLEACLLAAGQSELVRGATGRSAIRSGSDDFLIRATFFHPHLKMPPVECTSSGRQASATVPCAYFSSWRAPKLVGPLSITAGKKGKRPYKTEENRLWIVKQALIDAKAHASMSHPGTIFGKTRYDEAIDRINEIWEMFYPGREESFAVDPVGDDPSEGFDVFFNSQGGCRISLDSLSSGQLELFLLAGSGLTGASDESIVLMDEPELHLDPQWHRLILRAIQRLRPRSQLIIGTHSPEIYDSVMSYQRHFLVSEDDPRSRAWSSAVAGSSPA